MTSTNLTAFISNITYPVLNTSYTLTDNADETSDVALTFLDANGTYSFQFGQPVTVTDTLEGVKFTGFVSKPKAVKYEANSAIAWTIDCVDNHFLTLTRTSDRVVSNQYAGVVAASMANDYLAPYGVVANYALREDNNQSDFTQGTLSGTIATSNNGGDLELSLAGSTVTILENTTSVFNSGTLNNVTASNNSLAPTTTPAIKMVCTQSVPGGGNSYTYVKIWQPSSTFTVLSGRFFAYDIWISSSSPECKFGVDIVFTDGTNVRGSSLYNDVQNIPPHPSNDLSGVAKDQWYHREFYLDNFSGKNIAYITVACEGDSVGTYTAYFKNINYENTDHSFNQAFFASSFNVNPPQQMQTNGYSNTKLSIVNTVDTFGIFRSSPSYSIDAAKIVKSSFITWQGTTPPNTSLIMLYSIDGGNSYATCANNTSLPNLIAGMSISGKSIIFAQQFTQSPGCNPEQPDQNTGLYLEFTSIECVIYPSYASSKTDVLFTTANSTWGSGTLTNTAANGGTLNLIGAVRNFDDGSDFNQGLYGGGASGFHSQVCNQKAMSVTVDASDQAQSRMDFAGTISSGIIEVDVYVDTNIKIGVTYLTTNWSNYDSNYAYAVEVTPTAIALQKGSNSSASSNGTRTQLATASLTLSSGNWYHLKVVFGSGSHTIYLNDVQYISVSDSTYTSAGYITFRVWNGGAGTYTAQWDNFGVVKALSGTYVSPSTSLSSASAYGNSVVWWKDVSSNSALVTLLVEAKINSGSYQTCTNGGVIPGLTVGQSLSSVTVTFRVTLTTSTASAMPGITYFNAYILGQFSSSGTRIAPMLSLTNALRAGSTVVNWTATTPTNTSVAVATSTDGTSYTNVANGGSIAGITSQPTPTLDTFSSNTSPNYTQTNLGSGSTSVIYDTINSRVTASSVASSVNTLFYNSLVSFTDGYVEAIFDQANNSGLVCRITASNSMYALYIYDSTVSNSFALFSIVNNTTYTQIASGSINFVRGTYSIFRLSCIGTTISVLMDGVQLASVTDSSVAGPGKAGLLSNQLLRSYSLWIAPQGDDLTSKVVYSKVTLTSTDPTATPQLLDLTIAALNPLIGLGSLISTVDYSKTYLSDNFNDLAKKSNYQWYIDSKLNFVFSPYVALPAPWVLQSADQQLLLDGPLTVEYSGDLYRNRHTAKGVTATGTASEYKIGDGTTTSWTVGGNIVDPPTVYLNGQLKTIGIKGVDTGKDFYYTPGSNAIDQDSSGTVLEQTDTLLLQNFTYTYTTNITVDNTNLAGTITQKQFAAIMGKTTGQVNVLNKASAAHTTSSDFGDLDVSISRRIAVDINITAVSGTSPTIQFFVDRKDLNGIYYNIWSGSTINAATAISTTIGAFATVNQALGTTARLRWTIAGTTPSFTFSASVIGIIDVQSSGLGVVEVVEDVSSQALDVPSAIAYCNTLLMRYGTIGRTLTFKTYRRNPSLAVGQSLPVFLPEHKITDALMLITQIQTNEDICYDSGSPSKIYYCSVTCSENAVVGSPYKLLASTLK